MGAFEPPTFMGVTNEALDLMLSDPKKVCITLPKLPPVSVG